MKYHETAQFFTKTILEIKVILIVSAPFLPMTEGPLVRQPGFRNNKRVLLTTHN